MFYRHRTSVTASLLLILAGGYILLFSRMATARQQATLVHEKGQTLLQFVKQASQQQNRVLVAEVVDEEALKRIVPPGRYGMKKANEVIQQRLDAVAQRPIPERLLCFTSAVAAPTAMINTTQSSERKMKQLKDLSRFLESLTPEQLKELKENNLTIAAMNLNPEQQEMMNSLGNGIVVPSGAKSFFQNPDARIELRFSTWAAVYPQDGAAFTVQVGRTSGDQ
jgi:hypothetical protein